jgi:hypothetical protein
MVERSAGYAKLKHLFQNKESGTITLLRQGRLTKIIKVGLAAAILTSCGAMTDMQVARALSDGAFTYTVSGGDATITGCQATCPTELVLPDSIGGYPVRAVSGFIGLKLRTVNIPNSVTTINENAFRWSEITSLALGDSVRTIGGDAFAYNMINSITFPATLQSIGWGAFWSNELAYVYFRGDAPTLEWLNVNVEFFYQNRGTIEYIARSPSAHGWTSEIAGYPVIAVDPATRTRTQLISMQTFTDHPLGQAIRFNVAASSSSGRPVSIVATGSCYRSDDPSLGDGQDPTLGPLSVTIVDIGVCTIRAFEPGNYEWLPAESVTRSFRITRTMLSNVKIKFVDAAGNPGRISVSWSSGDGKFVSTKNVSTNSQGIAVFPKLPTGTVGFTYSGSVGNWKTQLSMGTGMLVRPSTTPLQMVIGRVDYPPERTPTEYRIRVIMADGTVVPGASVQIDSNSGRYMGNPGPPCMGGHRGDAWDFTACVVKDVTDSAGFGTLNVIGPYRGSNYYGVRVSITDGDVSTIAYGILDHELTVVELEQMPAAYIEIDPATINYGAAQTVTAIARNGDGSPITGRSLTLSASTSGASASCSGRKTTATTNSSGRATFKVCPVKTATWSVDGRSIVGSAGVRLTVQLTPTAPRTLVATPKTRSVSLVWAAPAKANASSVADYIVQYRLQGATTWVTFRDGTSTARKATVTGLTSGQIYEFRVAAKNKSGTGTWSNVVLGTPN